MSSLRRRREAVIYEDCGSCPGSPTSPSSFPTNPSEQATSSYSYSSPGASSPFALHLASEPLDFSPLTRLSSCAAMAEALACSATPPPLTHDLMSFAAGLLSVPAPRLARAPALSLNQRHPDMQGRPVSFQHLGSAGPSQVPSALIAPLHYPPSTLLIQDSSRSHMQAATTALGCMPSQEPILFVHEDGN